ncbi:uncharacterized protein LOC133201255 [Saccostrea echinata]|uniref:uncharacterized protein LOC133201255 n=1 Tax=Saccostrea echinata TaxID=191078 RepID=UPI002A82EF50|nr:uncharacterized protein LOC133201255 [Saccostrea echinata]
MESDNTDSLQSSGSEEGQSEGNRTTDKKYLAKRPGDFKTIYSKTRQPALTQLNKEKQHKEKCDYISCEKKESSTQTLGTKAVYQKMSPDSAKKRNMEESSDDKENSGGAKSCRRKFDYTQAVYKKGATLFSILELDCTDSTEPPSPKPEPLTLNKNFSQLVPFSRKKSTFHQFEQTMYYSCTPEQLSLHKLRCSIYSSLGASWSIVNPEECKRVCFQCFNKQKVESMFELTPGDHISIHRSVGYEHHAIVVDVSPDKDDPTSGFLRVIHRSANAGEVARGILLCMITVGQYGNLAYLREEDVKFDLKKQDVYIIQYKNKPFTRSKIIRRARAEVENDETLYSISSDNCEHFANWCATGEYYSHQIGLLKATLQMLLFSDNEGYNRMLDNLAENGIMCEECFQEAKRAQEESRLNQEKAEKNSVTHMLP